MTKNFPRSCRLFSKAPARRHTWQPCAEGQVSSPRCTCVVVFSIAVMSVVC